VQFLKYINLMIEKEGAMHMILHPGMEIKMIKKISL
jgi:hypothetical protein